MIQKNYSTWNSRYFACIYSRESVEQVLTLWLHIAVNRWIDNPNPYSYSFSLIPAFRCIINCFWGSHSFMAKYRRSHSVWVVFTFSIGYFVYHRMRLGLGLRVLQNDQHVGGDSQVWDKLSIPRQYIEVIYLRPTLVDQLIHCLVARLHPLFSSRSWIILCLVKYLDW